MTDVAFRIREGPVRLGKIRHFAFFAAGDRCASSGQENLPLAAGANRLEDPETPEPKRSKLRPTGGRDGAGSLPATCPCFAEGPPKIFTPNAARLGVAEPPILHRGHVWLKVQDRFSRQTRFCSVLCARYPVPRSSWLKVWADLEPPS